MGLSGTWRTQAYAQAPVVGARDPAHNDPAQQTTGRNWSTAPPTPALMPTETIDGQDYTLDSAPGGLPWTPAGHDDGVGYGPGLSWAASSAQNDAAHLADDGSYIPRMWQPAVDRDGEYHVDRWSFDYETQGPVSPVNVAMQSWTDPTYYPNRRPGHIITRWRDRVYERRNWNTEFRPIVIPNAYSAPGVGAITDGNQYTSPYPNAVATDVRTVNTTAPQLRRTPAPWDESITSDGTAQVDHPALGSWGM